MGKLINANKEEFKEIINSEEGVVLVDFSATWCGPCRMIGPVLEDIAKETEDAVIVKLDVDENPELSAEYGIRSIPAVFAIKNGEVMGKLVGAQNKEAYIKLIEDNLEIKSDEQEG